MDSICQPQLPKEERYQLLTEKLDLTSLESWPPGPKHRAKELLLENPNVFTLEKDELGCSSRIKHEIELTDEAPFKCFRQIPLPLIDKVRSTVKDMLDSGAIHPSQSLWCNVLVQKQDGSLHFCIDFRCLNDCTKKNSYLLPRINEALESLADIGYFSSLDLESGFWQVLMDEPQAVHHFYSM